MRPEGVTIALLLLVFASFGCLGMGEGYDEKAQEYTSADYTIAVYKEFITDYNAICGIGSSAEYAVTQLENFDETHSGELNYQEQKSRDHYQSVADGYIMQYNRLASQYNTNTMDKTQDWLMIASLPEHINTYTQEDHLTNDDVIDDEVLGSELLGD